MEKRMKGIRKYAGQIVLVLFVLCMGLWHYFDTAAGAAGAGDLWLCGMYQLLFAVSLLFLGVLFLGLFRKHASLPVLGALSVLFLGSMFMLTLPPLSAPDEATHFANAYAISNRLLRETAQDEYGHVYMRREDEFLQNIERVSGNEERKTLGRDLSEETWKEIAEHVTPVFAEDGKKEMVPSVLIPVNTTSAAHFFPALGITLGRLLGVNCIFLVFMGRFFNLLFFAAAVYGSMRLLPFGKHVLWGIALLPMSLHLAASYSYDTFLMGMCFFFGSFCFDLAFAKPKVQKRDIFVLAILAAGFGPCKMVYSVMLGFALLIPVKKFGGWKNWAISAGVVLLAFGLAMMLVNFSTISNYAVGEENYVAWAAEEGYSIPYILHNPASYAKIMYNSFAHLGDEWTLQLLGDSLGNLDPVLSVPFLAGAGMLVCIVLLSIRNAGEALYLSGLQKLWICFLAFVCLCGLMSAMLVGWTPISSVVIEGVQGRYVIPFLPFVFMCMKSDRLVRTDGKDEMLIFCICALDCYAVLRLFSIVSMRL